MDFEGHTQFADQCVSVKLASSAETAVLQALQFQEVSVRRMHPGGTGSNFNINA
jgi:hypothetical protein